jgi:hypothetical protein
MLAMNNSLAATPRQPPPVPEVVPVDRSAVPAVPAVGTGSSGPSGADDRIVPASPRRPRTAASPLVLILAGGIIALLLGSRPLLGWIEALPNPGALQPAAVFWHDAMARLGLTTMDNALRRFIRAFEAQRFGAPADRQR